MEGDLGGGVTNSTKCLLPLVQINHAVLPNVNCIEKILDHRVSGCLLSRELVDLGDELAEIGKGDATIFVNVKLNTKSNTYSYCIVIQKIKNTKGPHSKEVKFEYAP